MNIVGKVFIYSTLALLIGFILVFEFFMLYPFRVIDMQQPYHLLTKDVHAGDVVLYQLEYCKYLNVKAQTDRFLVGKDGARYAIPAAPIILTKGCGIATSTATLPLDMISQTYYINVINTYNLPFGRKVVKDYKTQEFFVKPVIIPVIPI